MTEGFSAAAGQNFKLEMNVVKLFLQDKFVLEFWKVAMFLNKGHQQTSEGVKMGCFAHKNATGDTKLKKLNVFY